MSVIHRQARFLSSVNVPEEFFADTVIVGLFQQYKESQAEFKEIHKAVAKLRKTSMKPQELQKEIKTLEGEREQLNTKLGRLRDKIGGSDVSQTHYEAVLDATHMLRKEQEEEGKLFRSTKEQKHKQLRSEHMLEEERQNLQELEESDLINQDPRKLLDKLRKDVQRARTVCDDDLEKEIRAKEKELRELEKTMSSAPMTEDEVELLEGEVAQLSDIVEDLTMTRDSQMANTDSNIKFYRERVAAVEKKKELGLDQLQDLEQEKNELSAELNNLQEELNAMWADGHKPKTDAEINAYVKELSKKTNVYRSNKAELVQMKQEMNILMRTEEILRSRDENLQEFTAQMEREQGVTGSQATQDNLEDVSRKKEDLNNKKAMTLDEISRHVDTITQTLKSKKQKLAPQIKDLRSIRHRFDDVEQEYLKKKRVYDNTALGYESERLKLEQDVTSNMNSVMEEESRYHFIHCLKLINSVRKDMMRAEMSYQVGDDTFSDDHKSYQDAIAATIKKKETEGKKLRKKKKSVAESHDSHVEQRKLFVELRALLQSKKDVQIQVKEEAKAERNNIDGMSLFSGMEFGDVGVDRMVL